MLTIPLSNIPNQELEFVYAENIYRITLKTFRDMTYCNIAVNDVAVLSGVRCIKDQWLLRNAGAFYDGDFRFDCDNDDYPIYDNFGKSCYLRFYTTEETNV